MTVEEIATKADIQAVLQEVKALAATVNSIASIRPDDNDYFTRPETSKTLRCSLPKLTQMTKEGKIKAYRNGRTILYRRKDVMNALEEIKSIQEMKAKKKVEAPNFHHQKTALKQRRLIPA